MTSLPSFEYATDSAPTSKSVVIAAKVSTKRQIRKATFINNSGAPMTFDLYINPAGTKEILFLPNKQLADKETWSCIDLEGQVIEPNGTLSLDASVGNMAVSIASIRIT
jgi:hypothetical protein